jgi:RNA polymerase sigma factor (sigma-70 family)
MASAYPDTPATLLEKLAHRELEAPWHEAWQTFTDLYLPAIRWSVLRSFARCNWHRTPNHMVEDVLSDVVVALVRGQEKFHYNPEEGRFRNYIKQLVHWKVIDRIKAHPNHVDAGMERLDTHTDESVENGLESLARREDEAWEASTLGLLLEEVRRRVSPQTYMVFEMTKLQNRPVEDVMEEMGMTRSAVDTANHRVMKALSRLASTTAFKRELMS